MTYFTYARQSELAQLGLNKLDAIVGSTIDRVEGCEKGSEVVKLFLSDGNVAVMYHDQDCCEGVEVEDVCGDIADLIGSPILMAEEYSQSDADPEGFVISEDDAR